MVHTLKVLKVQIKLLSEKGQKILEYRIKISKMIREFSDK